MAEVNMNYEDLKKRGFLKQKQEGFVILRTRMERGVYNDAAMAKIGEISRKYATGIVHATTRQGLEIPFVRPADAPKIEEELKAAGIAAGASGARLRATTVCPGNNWCRFGLIDTFGLAAKIEEAGLKCGIELPHKFKIAISGCPNGCTRPQAAEIGIHGQLEDKTAKYALYAGGAGGREPRAAFKLPGLFTEDEAVALVKKIIEFFRANAKPRQRLGALIEEYGKEKFVLLMGAV